MVTHVLLLWLQVDQRDPAGICQKDQQVQDAVQENGELCNSWQTSAHRVTNRSIVQENIANFLKGARAFGMKEFEMFGTPDLYDEKNIMQVVSSIHALGRTVQKNLPDWGRPNLGIKVVEKNVREWTPEQLAASRNAVSLLNLGSSDHGKKAAMAVLDGTGELDDSHKAEKFKKQQDYKKQMLADSKKRTEESALDKKDAPAVTGGGAGSATSATPAAAVPAPAAAVAKEAKWEAVTADDGSVYYRHVDTYETAWELPAGEVLIGSEAAADVPALPAASNSAEAGGDGEWEEVAADDGSVYYRHIVTWETAWELPEGGKLVGAGGGDVVVAADATGGAEAKWEEVAAEDGSVYYRHIDTYETAWELPEGAQLIGGDAAAAAVPATDAGGDVYEAISADDGSVYYRHVVTWETAWELPEGATLQES